MAKWPEKPPVMRTADQTDKQDDHKQAKKGQPCIVCSKIKHTPIRNLPCSPCKNIIIHVVKICRKRNNHLSCTWKIRTWGQTRLRVSLTRRPPFQSIFPRFSFSFFFSFFPHSLQYYLVFYTKCTTQMEYLYYIYICTAKGHNLVLLWKP